MVRRGSHFEILYWKYKIANFHAYKLYKSSDFSSWRQRYHSCFKKYIKLRSELQFKVDNFYNKNLKDSFVIGAHIRHTSHIIEQPGLKMPTLDTFKGHIEMQLNLAKKSQSKPVKAELWLFNIDREPQPQIDSVIT